MKTAAINEAILTMLGRLVAIFLFAPVTVFGQSVGQDPLEFKENLREEATISGALLAGVQRHDGRFNASGNLLYLEVPREWAGGVACLRVSTSNGLYDSEAEYPISAGSTLLPLRFPTRHARYLADRPLGGVAALISRGECSEQSAESAVIRWSTETETPVVLFLNAFRADRTYVYLDEQHTPVECTPLESDVRTAYDVQCNLGAFSGSDPVRLEILTITNGQPSEPTTLTLLLMQGG